MSKKGFIYTDGGARGNPGPAAIGVLITDEKGKVLKEHGEVIGATTNNVAEYTGVIVAFEFARQLGFDEIDYYGDSQLVVRQLSGEYKIKAPHIQSLVHQVQQLQKNFKRVRFYQVPREHEKIQIVDKLVNQALDEEGY